MGKCLAGAARDAWARLEGYFRRHPPLLHALNTGASEAELEGLERLIGQPLPPDVRASLSIHNGVGEGRGLFLGDRLLPVADIATEWGLWQSCTAYNDDFRDVSYSYPEGAVALDYANPRLDP